MHVIKNALLAMDVEVGTFDGERTIIGYYRRRRFNCVIADIPTNIRNRLNADRQITVTWTQVKNYVKNLRANALLSDTDLA